MNEIELDGVTREEFIEILRMIYPSNRAVTYDSGECLLELADQFQMLCVTERVEMFLMDDKCILTYATKSMTADEYRLFALQEHCLANLKTTQDVKSVEDSPKYNDFSDEMKAAILERKSQIERESESGPSASTE
ncbi:hypothetical protein PMAYCL1PPCAC_25202 [Pristionchus mayeri]|uniref:BTB domain-containing protein n=1 Tax=Pristionchus mayeri TaxID=1317129 RepID=A0AAN5D2R1_9BILA|nr:hypothetical protein PMAYCL1PPCAC_25202 [Pristionchus mayeri]